jgi:hypothetical protein
MVTYRGPFILCLTVLSVMLQDNEGRSPVELEVRESPSNTFNRVPSLYDSSTEYCVVWSLRPFLKHLVHTAALTDPHVLPPFV